MKMNKALTNPMIMTPLLVVGTLYALKHIEFLRPVRRIVDL